MNTKEYLSQCYELNKQINMLLLKADEALLKAISVNPAQGDGIHSGGTTDKVGNNIAQYDYYIQQANILTDKLSKLKQDIINTLKTMPDIRYKTILYLRYIKLLPWNKIAYRLIKIQDKVYSKEETIQYEVEVRTNLHKAALKSFTKYCGRY